MRIVVLLGRILYSAIFISAGLNHLTNPQVAAYAASAGVPLSSVLVPLSGIMALIGGLSILFGYKAKAGAWLIVAFLIPVTLMMHAFWTVSDPQARMMQMVMFNKNLTMLGGAFLITYFGSGPLSIEKADTTTGGTAVVKNISMPKVA
jgi:putative oxidoreductase